MLRGVPLALASRSFSFCSRASARRLRKSERATRPTVWLLSSSSAVLVCEVKRGLGVEAPGVEVPDGGLDAMLDAGGSSGRAEGDGSG